MSEHKEPHIYTPKHDAGRVDTAISCRQGHCEHHCAERCKFTPQADIDLEVWFAAREAARGQAAKEDAMERASAYEEWTQKPLAERLQKLLDDHEWDLPTRDINTLQEAIDALGFRRPFESYTAQPDTAERTRLAVQSIPFALPEKKHE